MLGFSFTPSQRERRLTKRVERLNAELDELHIQLQEERSTVRVLELEQGKLLEVIERDRRRVEAETKACAARIAGYEPHDGQ